MITVDNCVFDGIPSVYSVGEKNTSLIVFLPAARTHHTWPYFPRLEWVKRLGGRYSTLFLADPYQELDYATQFGGSWFFDPDGRSKIPVLAQQIRNFADVNGIKNLLFYGSSMGGYSALLLAALIPGSTCIAECPQIYLERHPGSNHVLSKLRISLAEQSTVDVRKLVEENCGRNKFIVVCNICDHHFQTHVLPFVEYVKSCQCRSIDIEVRGYYKDVYGNGHTALRFEHALPIIEQVMKG